MKDRLYINEQEIQLDTRQAIAYTLNGVDLSDIVTQKASHTTRIKIPATAENLSKLGNPERIASGDRPCYKLLPCEYWQGSFQTIKKGLFRIDSVTSQAVEGVAFSGETDVFKKMKGLELRDLTSPATYNHKWSISGVQTYYNKGGGQGQPFYPAINYGNKNPVSGDMWNYHYMFPAWYLFDLINLSFQDQGYSIDTPELLKWAIPWFIRLFIPFSNKEFQNGEAYVKDHSFEAQSSTFTTADFDHENTTGLLEEETFIQVIDLPTVIIENANYSDPEFTEPNASKITLFGEFNVNSFTYSDVDLPPTDPPLSFYKIAFIRNGTEVVHAEQIGANGVLSLGVYSIEGEVQLDTGDTVSLAFVADVSSDSLGDEVHIDATLNNATLSTQKVETIIYPEGWIELNEQLPELSQADLIRFAAAITASYVVADPIKKKWTFKPFVSIYENKTNALEWDAKIIREKGQNNWYVSKKTKIDRFFQTNNVKWLEDDTVTPSTGDGSFTIDNETLDESGEIIDMVFAASDSRLTLGSTGSKKILAAIDRWDEDDKTQDIEPRLLIFSAPDSSFQIQLTDADSGGTSGPTIVPYPGNFSSANLPVDPVEWELGFKKIYWTELIGSLQNFVEVEVLLALTSSDISDLVNQYQGMEEIKPIYLQGNYWLIKQIKGFRNDDYTLTVLTKIQ